MWKVYLSTFHIIRKTKIWVFLHQENNIQLPFAIPFANSTLALLNILYNSCSSPLLESR